jgi:crotonobetainyl-CoA:carnitine CoA-transferase CaiB-like acyl-CoA transferase
MLLDGLRVLELVDERTAVAGRLLTELGANVTLVEPPGGSPLRASPPFVDDQPGQERSLKWWSNAGGKRSVVSDIHTTDGRARFRELVERADVVLEGSGLELDRLGIGWSTFGPDRTNLIWISVTPFGRESPRSEWPATDLTLLASGGPLWNCGYDDHSIPPIRGAGDQAFNIAGLYASIACLVAVAHRDVTGRGQLADVNINAACNVTCEQTTYNWLLIREVCTRQTGRHAFYVPTAPVQVRCADGRYATTGVLPTKPSDFAKLYQWLAELEAIERLPEAVFLELAANRSEPVAVSAIGVDDEVTAILSASRDAIVLIASLLPADEFYVQSQQRGFQAGSIRSPDEGFADPHFVARGFHRSIEDGDLSRTITSPGLPFVASRNPTGVARRPPRVNEHGDDEVPVRSSMHGKRERQRERIEP